MVSRAWKHGMTTVNNGAGMGADHETTDLANLIVGGGTVGVKHAGHVDYKDRPLADLYVRMLNAGGVKAAGFADSTGPLDRV